MSPGMQKFICMDGEMVFRNVTLHAHKIHLEVQNGWCGAASHAGEARSPECAPVVVSLCYSLLIRSPGNMPVSFVVRKSRPAGVRVHPGLIKLPTPFKSLLLI